MKNIYRKSCLYEYSFEEKDEYCNKCGTHLIEGNEYIEVYYDTKTGEKKCNRYYEKLCPNELCVIGCEHGEGHNKKRLWFNNYKYVCRKCGFSFRC